MLQTSRNSQLIYQDMPFWEGSSLCSFSINKGEWVWEAYSWHLLLRQILWSQLLLQTAVVPITCAKVLVCFAFSKYNMDQIYFQAWKGC